MSDCGCNDSTPCASQECGCKFEVDAGCIEYTSTDLSCINTLSGATVDEALQNINLILCELVQGTYTEVIEELPGSNCFSGGLKIIVKDINTGDIVSTDYLCRNSTTTEGYVSITEIDKYSIGVDLVGIPGPVTYQWSFADISNAFSFSSTTNIENPTFLKNEISHQPFKLDTTGTTAVYASLWKTLIKVIVTDVNGNTYSAYYNYTEEKSLYE